MLSLIILKPGFGVIMKKRIKLTPKAHEDMAAIWLYGFERFGVAQADSYIKRLSTMFENLARYQMGVRRKELGSGIYSQVCASHVLFFTPQPEAIVIIRVLHHSQDVLSHLEA